MSSIRRWIQAQICGSARTASRGTIGTIWILLMCGCAFSQVNQGRILGTVTDQSGGAVAGAAVSVIDVARGVTHPLTTDSAGEYVVRLIPGNYTVRAEAMGFKILERENITVDVGAEVRVDMTLVPGSQTQTVTVTESAVTINAVNAELGGTVEDEQYQDLPIVGRQYWHLLDFAPGVLAIPGGDSIGYASNGGRVSNSMWLFDGVDETEMWSGTGPVAGQRQASIVPVDAIQGVDIVQNPNAEYGWRVGAIVNLGIKSGTNSIHGSAYLFDRNGVMDARNPFVLPGSPKQTDNIEDFGGSFGGPIKKDKLFYFLSYEGERFAVGNPTEANEPTMSTLGGGSAGAANSFPDAINAIKTYIATHPGTPIALSPLSLALAGCTAAAACNPSAGVFGAFPTSTEKTVDFNDAGGSHNGLGKLDYHLSDHHALNFEYYAGKGDEYSPGSIQNYWAEGSPELSELGRGVWVWTPNSTWVNQARFGNDVNGGPVLPEECVNNLGQPNYASAFGYVSGTAGNPPSCAGKAFSPITIGNFTQLGNDSGGTTTFITHYSGLDTVSFTRGKHAIKFGGEIHFIHFTGFGKLTNLIGTVDFGNGAIPDIFPGATPLEDFLGGEPDSGALLIGSSALHIHQSRYAGFVQDDWRVLPRVIVNLGLRYEYQTPIQSTTNGLGNFNPNTPTGLVQENGKPLYTTSHKGFGPRLGVVWDVTGKGTTVVRVGGSIVDDNIINFNDLLHTVFGAALQVIPTGWNLTLPNGSVITPAPGNIQAGTVTLTGQVPGGASLGQLNWVQNQPVFNSAGTVLACGNGLIATAPGKGTNPAPCTLNVINPHIGQSYVNEWTLAISHAITHNLALNVAYVGNHGTSLAGIIDVNAPTPGTKGSSAEIVRRPYYSSFPYFGQIREYTPDLESNYNGLQANLVERVMRGLTANIGYTYSHALDDTSSISSFNAFENQNPNLNYGNSTEDVRNHFTATATYVVPGVKVPGQLLQGWVVSTTINLLGAFPYQALDTTDDFSGTGEKADRWNLVGPPSAFKGGYLAPLPCYGVAGSTFAASGACTVEASVGAMPQICQTEATNEPINSSLPAGTKNGTGLGVLANIGCYASGGSAIVPPAQGTFGDMARDVLRDSPFREWDMNVTKDFKIKERYTIQFRGDFFNIINSVEYAVPPSNPANPVTFGVAQGTISSSATVSRTGAPRNILLGLKFIF